MSFSRSSINPSVFFLSLVNLIVKKLKHKKKKTHDFTKYVRGNDYVFEIAEDSMKAYMTAQTKDVKCGDYIILQIGSESCRYQVEQIDYYANPSDMWMALIRKVIDN
jgi:ribosome biogenesis protein Nip4